MIPVTLSGVLLLTGCATVVYGVHQEIPVTSTPAGAVATIGEMKITTPGKFTLERNKDQVVIMTKDGCQEERVQLIHAWDHWPAHILGNIWLWPLMIVDWVNGSADSLRPAEVAVTLRCAPASQA